MNKPALNEMTFFRSLKTNQFEFLDDKVGYRLIKSEELKQEPICYMIRFTLSQDGQEDFSLSLGQFNILESDLAYTDYEKYTRLHHRGFLPQYLVTHCQTYQKTTLSEHEWEYSWSTHSKETVTAFNNGTYGYYQDIGENESCFPLKEPSVSELEELFDCIKKTREDVAISMLFVHNNNLSNIEIRQAYRIHEIFIKGQGPHLRPHLLKLVEMYQQKDPSFRVELQTLFNQLISKTDASVHSMLAFFENQLLRLWYSMETSESQKPKYR